MSPDSVSKMPIGDAGSSCATDRIELEHDWKKQALGCRSEPSGSGFFPMVVPDDD
jgi:hypothetical protein